MSEAEIGAAVPAASPATPAAAGAVEDATGLSGAVRRSKRVDAIADGAGAGVTGAGVETGIRLAVGRRGGADAVCAATCPETGGGATAEDGDEDGAAEGKTACVRGVRDADAAGWLAGAVTADEKPGRGATGASSCVVRAGAVGVVLAGIAAVGACSAARVMAAAVVRAVLRDGWVATASCSPPRTVLRSSRPPFSALAGTAALPFTPSGSPAGIRPASAVRTGWAADLDAPP